MVIATQSPLATVPARRFYLLRAHSCSLPSGGPAADDYLCATSKRGRGHDGSDAQATSLLIAPFMMD